MSNFTPDPIKLYHLWVKPVLPLVYDEALSYLETLGQVVTKLNEVITWANDYTSNLYQYVDQKAQENLNQMIGQLNSFKAQIESQLANYDGRISSVENQLNSTLTTVNNVLNQFQNDINNQIASFQLQYQTDINQFKADTNKQLEDQNAAVQAAILQNTAYVNAQISTLTSLINLKSDENKQYTDQQIAELQKLIPEINALNIAYPGNSITMPIQDAFNNAFNDLRFWACTADEYDSLQLTAEEYDSYLYIPNLIYPLYTPNQFQTSLQAYHYDYTGKFYLYNYKDKWLPEPPSSTGLPIKGYLLFTKDQEKSWKPKKILTSNLPKSLNFLGFVNGINDNNIVMTKGAMVPVPAPGDGEKYLKCSEIVDGQATSYEIGWEEVYSGPPLPIPDDTTLPSTLIYVPASVEDGEWKPKPIQSAPFSPGASALMVTFNQISQSFAYIPSIPVLIPTSDQNNYVLTANTAEGSIALAQWKPIPSQPASTIPSGTIVMWSGSVASIPAGWVLCDGNNNTPNLVGKFILGANVDVKDPEDPDDPSNPTIPTNISVGQTAGEWYHTLTIDQIPQHNHSYNMGYYMDSTNGNLTKGLTGLYKTAQSTTGIAGSSYPHNNMPPYYALCFIMKQ